MSESQRVMHWQLILREFGPNIQHIYGVENVVADTFSRFLSTPSIKYNPCTRKDQCCPNKLFAIGRVEKPLNILLVQSKQQK